MVREIEDGKSKWGTRLKEDWKELGVNSIRGWYNQVKDRGWLASKLGEGRKNSVSVMYQTSQLYKSTELTNVEYRRPFSFNGNPFIAHTRQSLLKIQVAFLILLLISGPEAPLLSFIIRERSQVEKASTSLSYSSIAASHFDLLHIKALSKTAFALVALLALG